MTVHVGLLFLMFVVQNYVFILYNTGSHVSRILYADVAWRKSVFSVTVFCHSYSLVVDFRLCSRHCSTFRVSNI
jgi:hypothetical protein